MGLLDLIMAPAEAAALIVVPSLLTNLWQFLAGPGPWPLLRRLAPLLLAIAAATAAAAGQARIQLALSTADVSTRWVWMRIAARPSSNTSAR
jgi:hypothetical protein